MKKVLSFVLVLSLVLGSFSMAFAADVNSLTDIADNANEQAITVVNDLGIVTGYPDGTFKAEQAVNRAEFAAMITRALAIPESALAGYTATTFKDTTGYGWAVPYLAFCESKGIMLGDGNGNAMPGRTITVNEAMTMTLRALGYTNNSSALIGTWPSNYVTLGQTVGLYDDVATDSTINRESAAQVIYNALTVGLVQVATDGTTNSLYIKGNSENGVQTLLTSGLGCEVEAAAVITGDEDSAINLLPYQGAYAVKYTKDDEVVAIGEIKSTFLTGEVDFTKNIIDVDGTEYRIASDTAITAGAYSFNNGDLDTSNSNLDDVVADGDTATIAVKLTGKTVNELYSVAVWDVTATELFEEDDLDEESITGYDFPLDDDDAIDTNAFWLVGVDSLDDIDVDNVLEIYMNSDNEISKLVVGTKSVTGQVTRINNDGDKFTIDGTAYEATDDFIAGSNVPEVGDEGTAYLNYDGKIAIWDEDVASSGNYAVYIGKKVSDGYDNEGDTVSIKLFTAEGEEITPELKDSVTITGIAANDIVEYSLDKNGKVNDITNGAIAGTDIGAKISKDNTLIGTDVVASNVVVFVKDGTDYSIDKIANLDRDLETLKFSKDSKGRISAILVDVTMIDGNDSFGVINAVSSATNDDDDKVSYLDALIDGKATSAFTDDETLAAYSQTTTDAGLQKIVINADGVITDAENVVEDRDVDVIKVSTATVTAVSSSDRNIEFDNGTYRVASGAVIYIWDADDEEWTIGTIGKLKGKMIKAYTTDEDDVVGFDIILAWEE